ncbi:MAG: hypothetical protein Q7S20_09905 [Gemmatimonadaceae bacterium]|nr:hypothetical protein [Gemmatimonadaceae bacterium]
MAMHREGISIVEVGGKRNLPAFCDVVLSFGIRLTVAFDTDSSDFLKAGKAQEEEFNDGLRQLAKRGATVVELNPRYEATLRASLGEALYADMCNKYPGLSKAVRARRIAADPGAPVPEFIRTIFGPYLPQVEVADPAASKDPMNAVILRLE